MSECGAGRAAGAARGRGAGLTENGGQAHRERDRHTGNGGLGSPGQVHRGQGPGSCGSSWAGSTEHTSGGQGCMCPWVGDAHRGLRGGRNSQPEVRRPWAHWEAKGAGRWEPQVLCHRGAGQRGAAPTWEQTARDVAGGTPELCMWQPPELLSEPRGLWGQTQALWGDTAVRAGAVEGSTCGRAGVQAAGCSPHASHELVLVGW